MRPKIILFAFHSTTVLKHYWEHLKDKADCWWLTFSPYVEEEIGEFCPDHFIFKNLDSGNNGSAMRDRVMRKLNSCSVRWLLPSIIELAMNPVEPDIIISDTTRPLLKYHFKHPEVMTVQTFHSVCYKKYIMNAENFCFDLVLLPGEYHKKVILDRFPIMNPDKLQVVGWPRTDCFKNACPSPDQKFRFLRRLGLDVNKKTLLYAPTHDGFYRKGMFPRNFGSMESAFEKFCRKVNLLKINAVVKFHPASYRLICNRTIRKIAQKHGVVLAHKKYTGHIDRLTEEYLWAADVLLSDVSGIIVDYLVLDRPIIFIEPDHENFDWNECDLPPNFRPGIVVKSLDEIFSAIGRFLEKPDEYHSRREEVLCHVFDRIDGKSSSRAAETILSHYEKFRGTKDE